ncbi:MAG: hypothetical protein ACFBSC_19220 [Microcoleaceae cyanobacterium]
MKLLISIGLIIASFSFSTQTSQASAYDIVCQFKYRMGEEGEEKWVHEDVSGTTRSIAKRRRREAIKHYEAKAQEAGLNFEVIYLRCEDPWGSDDGGDYD